MIAASVIYSTHIIRSTLVNILKDEEGCYSEVPVLPVKIFERKMPLRMTHPNVVIEHASNGKNLYIKCLFAAAHATDFRFKLPKYQYPPI